MIAGESHFIGEEVIGTQLTENVKIVHNYLMTKRSIVLKPKSGLFHYENEEDEKDLNQLCKKDWWQEEENRVHPDSWMESVKAMPRNDQYIVLPAESWSF